MKSILAVIAFLGACLQAPAQTRFATLYTFADGAAGGLISPGGILYGVFDGLAPTGSDCGGVFEHQPPRRQVRRWAKCSN